MVEESGVHVAFAAGTGILTFMDLIAAVARTALKVVEKKTNSIQDPQQIEINQFSLILYVSFNSQASLIGLDLCKSLSEFCQRHSLENFKLHIRIS